VLPINYANLPAVLSYGAARECLRRAGGRWLALRAARPDEVYELTSPNLLTNLVTKSWLNSFLLLGLLHWRNNENSNSTQVLSLGSADARCR